MNDTQDRLIKAYHDMMQHLREAWTDVEEKALPPLKERLDQAMQQASDLGELSREEAERVREYVRRDVEEAAGFMSENGRQLKEWLQFDLQFAESKFAEMFAAVADRTRLELDALAERARRVGEWHTGEITGVGILQCKQCGEILHFEKPGHIPPCPKCQGSVFKKYFGPQQQG